VKQSRVFEKVCDGLTCCGATVSPSLTDCGPTVCFHNPEEDAFVAATAACFAQHSKLASMQISACLTTTNQMDRAQALMTNGSVKQQAAARSCCGSASSIEPAAGMYATTRL
jgi:hypothetical protein